LARECVTADFPRVYIAVVPVFQKVILWVFTVQGSKNIGFPLLYGLFTVCIHL